jgi:hypothetical protein
MHEAYRTSTEIKRQIAEKMPNNPVLKGWHSYSQCDEDGIIRECMTRIKDAEHSFSNTFIEFGCGNGLENNTAQLLLDGSIGCWVDGDHANIEYINENLGGLVFPSLWVRKSFVDLDNVVQLTKDCADFLGTKEIDFFSLDLDGNDSHFLPLILSQINPKLICAEYNAKFPPPTELEMAYSKNHTWQSDDYFGASLQSFVNIFKKAGYVLICCNVCGSNAFFIHEKFAGLFTEYASCDLYQPARYWMLEGAPGHPPSLNWVRQVVNERKTGVSMDIVEKFRFSFAYSFPAIQNEIMFGLDGNDSPYLHVGFGHSEEGFRWTVGDRAVITFDAGEMAEEGFSMACDVFPFIHGHVKAHTVEAFVNGMKCGKWKISEPDKICLNVPALLGKNGKYVVEFKLPDAISPKKLGLSDDTRKLALAFRKITVEWGEAT